MHLSLKTRLIHTFWQWCEENNKTPYLQVAVDDHTQVPLACVINGYVLLNISGTATHHLYFKDNTIIFDARFSGKIESLFIPIERVSAVFIKDSEVGMRFPVTETQKLYRADTQDIAEASKSSASPSIPKKKKKTDRSQHLTLLSTIPPKSTKKKSPAKKAQTSSDRTSQKTNKKD